MPNPPLEAVFSAGGGEPVLSPEGWVEDAMGIFTAWEGPEDWVEGGICITWGGYEAVLGTTAGLAVVEGIPGSRMNAGHYKLFHVEKVG